VNVYGKPGEDKEDGESESPDYENTRRREEGAKSRDQGIKDPQAASNKPVGKNFEKAKDKTMPLKDLIAEHKKLVQILESGSAEEIKAEAEEQKRELEEYIREAEKGVDDGQYYHEGFEVIKPDKGKVIQPQNQRLHDQIMDQGKTKPMKRGSNKTLCPYCGHNTLFEEVNPGNILDEKRYRCTFCAAYLTEQEIIDGQAVTRMEGMMEKPNSTRAVTVPEWSPKSLQKSIDLKMNVKEFCGFDYTKSYEEIEEYASSKEYTALLKKYFTNLDKQERDELQRILMEGLKKNMSIKDIARMLNKLLQDKSRSSIVARTEVIRITNEGNIRKAEKGGAKKFIWISAPEDGRLCKKCQKLNGKIFNLKDIKNYERHPNCRCTTSEYVKV
jgi:SPP1 gp7 family putative phage head morphogenesis protein